MEKYRYWPSLPQTGMLIAIASLSVFFAALILAYAITLHGRTPSISMELPAQLWASTWLILASLVTLTLARWAIRRAKIGAYRGWVVVTGLLGAAFAVSQVMAMFDLIRQGVYLEGNPRGSVFFAFTGFHGLHMFGGLISLGYLLASAAGLVDGEEQPIRRNRVRAGIVRMYWAFLTVSWLVLFALLLHWGR